MSVNKNQRKNQEWQNIDWFYFLKLFWSNFRFKEMLCYFLTQGPEYILPNVP